MSLWVDLHSFYLNIWYSSRQIIEYLGILFWKVSLVRLDFNRFNVLSDLPAIPLHNYLLGS